MSQPNKFETPIPDWCPTGYTLYQYHKAMNLHFSKMKTNYDFFKYNGKVRSTIKTFNADPLKWSYATLEKQLTAENKSLLYPIYLEKRECGFDNVMINKGAIRVLTQKVKAAQDLIHFEVLGQLKKTKSFYGQISGLNSKSIHYPSIFEFGKKNSFCDETYLCYDMFIAPFLYKEMSDDPVAWPMFLEQIEKKRKFLELFVTDEHIKEYRSL